MLLAPYRLVAHGDAVPAPALAPASLQPLPAAQPTENQQKQQHQQQLLLTKPLLRVASTASVISAAESDGAPASSSQAAGARAQRKRKPSHISFADDMLPTDVLARRKPRNTGFPPAGAPCAGLPLLAALKTEPGASATGAALQCLPSAPGAPAPGVPPYALVPARPPEQVRPSVAVASPWDVTQLRRAIEGEERRRAAEALRERLRGMPEDARVALRVLPGEQAPPRPRGPKLPTQDFKDEDPEVARAARQVQAARRAQRASRRGTPEPTDPLASLPPGSWHPGFSVAGGLGLVEPDGAAGAPIAPPLLVVGTPPRWSQPSERPRPPEFSEDAVEAALQYLHYAAVAGGRLPAYGGQLQQAVNAEHRLYKERLRRIHYARWARPRHLRRQPLRHPCCQCTCAVLLPPHPPTTSKPACSHKCMPACSCHCSCACRKLPPSMQSVPHALLMTLHHCGARASGMGASWPRSGRRAHARARATATRPRPSCPPAPRSGGRPVRSR